MCITYIYILSHSHLHHVYYFYHVNSSENNNYNLFSIFEIIKQKKPLKTEQICCLGQT